MLSVNPFDPHPPFDPPPEFLKKYNLKIYLLLYLEIVIFYEKQFSSVRSQKLRSVNPLLDNKADLKKKDNGDEGTGSRPPEYFDGLGIKAAYYAMIENIDHQFGLILENLKKNNQIENTIIIFTSDHGELLGDHGLIYKGCKFFEGLIHNLIFLLA